MLFPYEVGKSEELQLDNISNNSYIEAGFKLGVAKQMETNVITVAHSRHS